MQPIDGKGHLINERLRAALKQARTDGLIGGPDTVLVDVVVSARLVEAAKLNAGVSTDAEMIQIALALLATEDDYGARLVMLRGAIPADIDRGSG